MHIILGIISLFAGYKWGDWRNWRLYYSTILFMILMDLIYNFLTYKYSMWEFETSFDKMLLPNHTTVSFLVEFIYFSSTVLIYLRYYPTKKSKQPFYIAFWIAFYSSIEYISFVTWKGISYHNGWNIWWSIIINSLAFPILKLHYKQPLWAWFCSIIIITFFWIYFNCLWSR